MSDLLEQYRKARLPLPGSHLVWELYGAGLENLGREGKPVVRALPEYGPDELLLRQDAVGICFSDIKVVNLGPEHPRLSGRDMQKEPVILGHEVSVTVVGVGENLKDRYRVGERYIVQADVFYKGVSMAYGYVLPGAFQQYGTVGKEVLEGDEGSYLLPVREETGYLQAALAEPWACVVAAYRIEHRQTFKKGGVALVYRTASSGAEDYGFSGVLTAGTCPAVIVAAGVGPSVLEVLRRTAEEAGGRVVMDDSFTADGARAAAQAHGAQGFDDIIVLGQPGADELRHLSEALGYCGVLNVVGATGLAEDVEVDVGRIHYDRLAIVGTSSKEVAEGYRMLRGAELTASGTAWFIGAAGPMGQMHVQRAVELEQPPAKILCTDIDDRRNEMLRLRVEKTARERGIEIRFVNPNSLGQGELESIISEMTGGAGFDDIVTLVPVPALVAQASRHLAGRGVMNIFAGIARGVKARLPLGDCFTRGVRYIGSSGSSLQDLADTLRLSEEGRLQTANSAAAIGGMNAVRDGLAAVKEGRFPGKTVIFPQFPDIPLLELTELKDAFPTVYARLRDGMFWTREAEDELFRIMLCRQFEQNAAGGGGGGRLFEGKVALVTGAAQGLGEAISHRLAREGASVVLLDLNEERVRGVADDVCARHGVETLGIRVDVTDEEQVAGAFRQAVERFGAVDIAVANAGILIAGAIEDFDVATWRKVIDVNLVGYMITAKHAARVMIPRRSGVIIQINSKSGKKGSFRNSAYAASKFGGVGLTQSLALELAPYGIRVNAICPGNLLDSPLWQDSLYDQYARLQGLTREEVRAKYEGQVPLGRGCTYDDVTNVLVFLASEQASYMTGQAINVTGGQQMD